MVLEIYPTPGIRSGFAQAIASRQHTGPIDDLRGTLYDVTKAAMDAMNVEFEYQVRRNLGPWLLSASAAPPPVQQQPLDTGPTEEQPPGPPPAVAVAAVAAAIGDAAYGTHRRMGTPPGGSPPG